MFSNDDASMEGDLESFPLLELLKWLHDCGRSVVMRVDVGGTPGWIFMQNGILFRCEWRGVRGVDALMALLQVQHGTFWLSKRAVSTGAANISTPTPRLLLECAIAMDEKHRPSAA